MREQRRIGSDVCKRHEGRPGHSVARPQVAVARRKPKHGAAGQDGQDRDVARLLDLRKVLIPEGGNLRGGHDGRERHRKLAWRGRGH